MVSLAFKNASSQWGVDWFVWRIVDALKIDPRQIRYEWSTREVVEAHAALDAIAIRDSPD